MLDIFLIYIAGYLTAFLLVKIAWRLSVEDGTLIFALLFSMLSWGAIFGPIIVIISEKTKRSKNIDWINM